MYKIYCLIAITYAIIAIIAWLVGQGMTTLAGTLVHGVLFGLFLGIPTGILYRGNR